MMCGTPVVASALPGVRMPTQMTGMGRTVPIKDSAALAEARGQSLSRVFQDGLQLLDSQGLERQLFDDFSRSAAAGGEESNVDFAVAAQAETLGAP